METTQPSMNEEKAFYQGDHYLDRQKPEMDEQTLSAKVQEAFVQNGPYSLVLDLGTGTGAQIRRNIDLGVLTDQARIIGIDINKDAIRASAHSFQDWAKQQGYEFEEVDTGKYQITRPQGQHTYNVEMRTGSAYDLEEFKGKADAVTALSLLEHTDMRRSLQAIRGALKPDGVFYALINYAGTTSFGPTPRALQETETNLMKMFNHVAIDNQFKGGVETGNSQCGTVLPRICEEEGLSVITYGTSDWNIGNKEGLVHTENSAAMVEGFTDSFYKLFKEADTQTKKSFGVTNEGIDAWYALRKEQIKEGTLEFRCTNGDVISKKE